MRRLIVVVLAVCSAAAAAMALGASLGPGAPTAQASGAEAHGTMHMDAKPVTIAQLKATFRTLLPATRCAAGDAKRTSAVRIRTAALKGVATAKPKVLKQKKASMKRAIALLRAAKALCAAPPAGGGGATPPGTPPERRTPCSADAARAGGSDHHPPHLPGRLLSFVETSATGTAGAFRLQVVNGSSISHFIGVRVPGEHGLPRPIPALRPGRDEVRRRQPWPPEPTSSSATTTTTT